MTVNITIDLEADACAIRYGDTLLELRRGSGVPVLAWLEAVTKEIEDVSRHLVLTAGLKGQKPVHFAQL